jgi:hypothetical protein
MVASRKRTPQMFMPTAPVPAAPTNAANMFTGPLKKKRDFDWASLLQGVGAGLLTGRNVGEGLGQGLILAQQIGDQRADNDRQQERIDLENARFDYTMQRDVKADQAAQDQLAQQNAAIDALNIPEEHKAYLRAGGSASYGDLFGAPKQPELRTFNDGDKEYQGYLGPDGKIVRVTENAPRWKEQAPGQSMEIDFNQDGVPDFTIGGGAGGIKTEWQSKDFNFANRLENSLAGMDVAEGKGYDPSRGGTATMDYIAQNNVGGLIGNFLTSDAGKEWYRNGKEALAVILRKDTGAAVTDKEFDLYGPMYLPMPDDPPEVKQSKKQALGVILNSLRAGGPQQVAPVAPPPPSAPDDDGYTIEEVK